MSNKKTTTIALKAVSELLDLVAEDRAESACVATDFKDSMGGKMHILLDILLTDTWDMAMIKVALATAEKRPDIGLTTVDVNALKVNRWSHRRKRCRHLAR